MEIKYHTIWDKTCHIGNDLSIDQVFDVCNQYGIDPCLHLTEFHTHPEFKDMSKDEIIALWQSRRGQ